MCIRDRVYIDKETGVSIDDCEAVSRVLSDLLDEADPIQDPYTFEVSSAGAEMCIRDSKGICLQYGELSRSSAAAQ